MLVASATAIGGGAAQYILFWSLPVRLGWEPWISCITCVAGVVTTGLASGLLNQKRLFIRLDALGLIVFADVALKWRWTWAHPMIDLVWYQHHFGYWCILRFAAWSYLSSNTAGAAWRALRLYRIDCFRLIPRLTEFTLTMLTATIVTLQVGYLLRMALWDSNGALPFQLIPVLPGINNEYHLKMQVAQR